MNSIHPTETASDGREFEQSRYIKHSDSLDRYIECGQCGFLVNLKVRAVGPSMGAIPAAAAKTGTISPPGPGTPTTDNYADPVDTNSGCPFCNSMNPKAIGRGSKDPWVSNTKNIENL
jgi:DNA-directed RNA polymerase subunit RPC12/RpoP